MSEVDEPLPEMGEIVIATIVRITPYGAYATLDEYGASEGLLHISEISSRWVKNIRDHVREKKKTVLKVLRVDREKRHIDLSLRRVNEREKREKLLEWKREKKARTLLNLTAEKIGITKNEAYEKIGLIFENVFGSLYSGFETVAMKGKGVLVKAKIPPKWIDALSEIAISKIRIPLVKVKGTLELSCDKPNGVIILRDAFNKANNIKVAGNAHIRIYITGAPKYRIEVLAENYKQAEKILGMASKTALKTILAAGGEGKFTRTR